MSKKCNLCNTENENEYLYCKNCGNPLDDEYANRNSGQSGNGYGYYNPGFRADFEPVLNEIGGVKTEEIAAFVGPNAQSVVKKFSKMEITDSRFSWCWPVAVLSFIFGLFGTAIWFFYRKMYKSAICILLCALAVLGIKTAVTYDVVKNAAMQIENAAFSLVTDDEQYADFLEEIVGIVEELSINPKTALSNMITNIERFSSFLVFGIFSLDIYKKHCLKKIGEYKTKNGQSEYYNFGLSASGGVSAGVVVLAVFAWIIVSNAITAIPVLSLFLV